MPRIIMLAIVLNLGLAAGAAAAQSDMKATAAKKMTSPEQARRMRDCEEEAARQNIAMDQRSAFVMDCMTKKN
ncbi:MAG: hypothetical protein ACRECC_03970 [Pseudolabrys sp.]